MNLDKQNYYRILGRIQDQNPSISTDEARRRAWVGHNNILFEKSSSFDSSSSAAAGAGGTIYENYISQVDTIWLYPQSDINTHLGTYQITGNTYETIAASPSYNFTIEDNIYSFSSMGGLVHFFSSVYLVTEISQPIGNLGYSCGVGTRTVARKQDRLILQLNSGIKVVEWALMRQLTNQNDLPSGGNSPEGTIGWANIYCDWDEDGIQDPNSSAAGALSNLIDGLVFARI